MISSSRYIYKVFWVMTSVVRIRI